MTVGSATEALRTPPRTIAPRNADAAAATEAIRKPMVPVTDPDVKFYTDHFMDIFDYHNRLDVENFTREYLALKPEELTEKNINDLIKKYIKPAMIFTPEAIKAFFEGETPKSAADSIIATVEDRNPGQNLREIMKLYAGAKYFKPIYLTNADSKKSEFHRANTRVLREISGARTFREALKKAVEHPSGENKWWEATLLSLGERYGYIEKKDDDKSWVLTRKFNDDEKDAEKKLEMSFSARIVGRLLPALQDSIGQRNLLSNPTEYFATQYTRLGGLYDALDKPGSKGQRENYRGQLVNLFNETTVNGKTENEFKFVWKDFESGKPPLPPEQKPNITMMLAPAADNNNEED